MASLILKAVALGVLLAGGAGLLAAPIPLPPDPRSPSEIDAARADLRELKRFAERPGTEAGELFRRWRDFRARHPGTPECREAASLLARSPSPLDQLDRAAIPAEDRPDWLPEEVVTVLGQNRGRYWGTFDEVCVSPDGKLIGGAGTLFDATTLREWAALPPEAGKGWRGLGMTFAPKGRTFACLTETGVELWDATARPLRRTATLDIQDTPVRSLTFLRDGRTLVSTGPNKITFWDLAGATPRQSRALARHLPKGIGNAEAISPDGRFLVADITSFRTVDRLLIPTGMALLWRLDESAPRPVRLPGAAKPFLFTPDGQKLITGGLNGVQLSIWDLSRPGRVAAGGAYAAGLLRGADVSPDGTLLAMVASDDILSLWPLSEAGRKRLKLAPRETHRSYRLPPEVYRIKFAPDGRTLVVSCGCLLRLWDVDRQQERLPPRGHRGAVRRLMFAPDGAGLVTGGGDGTLRLWGLTKAAPAEEAVIEVGTRRPIAGPEMIVSVALSPDGRSLAAVRRDDQSIFIWGLDTPNPSLAARARATAAPGSIESCFFRPDGKMAVTLGADPNVGKKQPTAEDYANDRVDPDELPALRIWDWAGGQMTERQLLRPDHPRLRVGGGMSAGPGAFSPDGRQLAVVVEADVHVYRQAGRAFKEWACLRVDGQANSLAAFAADGRSLLVATRHERRFRPRSAPRTDTPAYLGLRLWDLTGKEPRGRLIERFAEAGSPRDMAVSPDGTTLALATWDGWLRVWDLKSEKRVREWKLPGAVWGLSFAPDSRHLATANANGTAFVFRLRPPAPPAAAK